ncbi:MAG TPA: hypothetical protein VFY91_03770 [Microbacterium sp.]|nr:hypothetical protein [Microbacterium sp.]
MNARKTMNRIIAACAATALAVGLAGCQTGAPAVEPAKDPAPASVDGGLSRPADRLEGTIQRRQARADAYTGHDAAERMGIERWCDNPDAIMDRVERMAAARHCATLTNR